jgi:hypothetical protein
MSVRHIWICSPAPPLCRLRLSALLTPQVACNSLVLAEESHFFTAKFSNLDFGGASGVVDLPDVDGDTLETVVAALLTACIRLDTHNIERILHCADMLQVVLAWQPALRHSFCLEEESCPSLHASGHCSWTICIHACMHASMHASRVIMHARTVVVRRPRR